MKGDDQEEVTKGDDQEEVTTSSQNGM